MSVNVNLNTSSRNVDATDEFGEQLMSDVLSPHDLAVAAAQGVAIALNARKGKGKDHEVVESFRRNPHIICGIPKELFEVTLEISEKAVAVGSIKAVQSRE